MRLSKKFALLAAGCAIAMTLAACGGGGSGGGRDGVTWKLAFNQTEDHPQFVAMTQLGKDLEEATDGRYGIEVFPNETLGSQKDVAEMVQTGSVEMMLIGGPLMEAYNPDFVVFNLPYLFETPEQQAEVLGDAAVVGDLYTSIEEDSHITVVAGLHAGVRNVYNSKKPIKAPADLSGMKIRVQESDTQVQMMKLMGGAGTPMGQGEVYTALQSGVLDGAENNELVFQSLKHSEVSKNYSYTRHLMIPDYLLINTDTYKDMSEEDRTTFDQLIPDAVEAANSGFAANVETAIKDAETAGATFNDDVDREAFQSAVKPLVDEQITNDTRKALYEAATEK